MKKLSDVNKNLPFIRSRTKKSDWIPKLFMQLSIVMWRWIIRSRPFFSGTAFILENVMAAAKDVEVFSVPISKSILVQIPG